MESLRLDARQSIDGSPAPWGYYALEGSVLRAHIPDDPWAAESILRIGYQVAALRQGGILVHGSGVRYGDRCVVAMGPSGAGKSTLAALCARSELGASLMSDEVILLHPDGWAAGTPFRSTLEVPGSPDIARLRGVFLLEKGDREQVEPLPAHTATAALMSQVFRPIEGEATVAEIFQRLGAVLSTAGVFRLTFRKHEAVGAFVRDWVHAGH